MEDKYSSNSFSEEINYKGYNEANIYWAYEMSNFQFCKFKFVWILCILNQCGEK